MSAGKVHTKASVMLAGAFCLSSIWFGNVDGVFLALGSLVGVVINPDLDVNHGNTDGLKHIKKRLGKPFTAGWQFMWFMYRKSLKHGSPLSHLPVVGTIGRLVYLFLFLVTPPVIMFSYITNVSSLSVLVQSVTFIISCYKVIIGLMCADLIHWALDKLTKENG